LDEPTVGVDPVLRQGSVYHTYKIIRLLKCDVFLHRIWDHLVHLTKDGGTTIIVTTHYIDETRQAHMVIITCII